MGKNKAQRTKNNARPSSSSRSAEFLGATAPSFTGFASSKDGGFAPVFPGLSLTSNLEVSNVDPNFQLVLKKMSKKDATTKYKALLEFSDMCKNATTQDVGAVLPFWPRLYTILSTDSDHRVREAVQIAHASVVKKVGKAIATHLKQLSGPWFTSQYDMYPPASSAATNSFNSTFPAQKFGSAVVHCQNEILNYICDNIVVVTPQSFSTAKSLSQEEMEAKYHRILSSSLQAYCLYLRTVTPAEIEKTVDYHRKLIASSKFWKLAKSEISAIKTAFFNALTALIRHASDLVFEDKKKVLTTVMNSMDESEPVVLTATWECLLLAVYKIEDWYTFVSIEKLVLPKLWKVLRNGGQYCASVVYPSLLPLLSQLTKLENNKTSILIDFFENLRQGITAKGLKLSRSEIHAMVTSFIECFKYVVLVQTSEVDFCKSLLKSQLMPMLEWCLADDSVSPTMRSVLFCELAKLLRQWCRSDSSSTSTNCYPILLSDFWTELESTLERLLGHSDDHLQESSHRAQLVGPVSELLDYLRRGNISNRSVHTVERQNSRRVRFAEEETPEENVETEDEKQPEEGVEKVFLEQLEKFVARFALGQLKRLENMKGEDEKLRHQRGLAELVKLISGHESVRLFEQLASVTEGEEEKSSLRRFFENQIEPYLAGIEADIVPALTEFVLTIISLMDRADDKRFMLSRIETGDDRISKIIVQCALTKKYCQDEVVRDWCGQRFVTSILLSSVRQIETVALRSVTGVDLDEGLFLRAFEPMPNGDLIVSSEAIAGISSTLASLVDQISWDSERLNERIASLLSQLINLAWSHRVFNESTVELLRAIFRLQVRNILEKGSDSIAVNSIAQNAWTKGLQKLSEILPVAAFIDNVKYFSTIIWKNIFSTDDTFKDDLVELARNFANTIIHIKEPSDKIAKLPKSTNELLAIFLTESDIGKWTKNLNGIVLCAEIFTGKFFALELTQNSRVLDEKFDIDLSEDDFEDDCHRCLTWATVSAKILIDHLSNGAHLSEASHILLNIIHVAALAESYARYYNFSKRSNEVQQSRKLLHDELNSLKVFLQEKEECMLDDLREWGLVLGGNFYLRSLRIYCDLFLPNQDHSTIWYKYVPMGNNHEFVIQSIQSLGIYEKGARALSDMDSDGDDDLYKVFLSRAKKDKSDFTKSSEDVFQRISIRQQMDPLGLLLDCEIYEAQWKDLILPLEVIYLFTDCVSTVPKQLSLPQWDLINLCLASWILSIKKSMEYQNDFKVRAMIVSVSQLYYAVQNIMNIHAKEPMEELPPSLLDEWRNVFATELQNEIFDSWIKLAKMHNTKDASIVSILPLNYLGRALKVFSEPLINHPSSAVDHSQEVIATLLELINSPLPSLQLGAHTALNHTIKTLVESDEAMIQAEGFDLSSLNIHKFEYILKTNQDVVNTLLSNFRLCDTESCTIQPHTEPYTYSFGYLFLWDIVLKMCASSQSDLRYHYAEILKDEFLPNFLNNIFRLIPAEALLDNYSKSAKIIELFTTAPSYEFNDRWTESRLSHMACWLYTNCLRYLPVLVRQWWSSADSRVSNAVDKITICYVSQFLCNEDFNNNRLPNVDNMQVKVHASAREVVALYEMDDTKLELNITLPTNHPLGTVTVEPGQHVGGSANWRNCHMQLSLFLTHQNGSIWDGLLLWKSNLDKRFAGVEECYICFSVFHISTYQIPQLSCQTCRKMFHKPCLYKWFSTSHKSTCPICRNVF